ncbi:glycosyltransferase [Halorubrum cibi]|uniref:Glycosyltransferase involved in cell wall bisynthesis n=1 Tax=Halorubrum cibi TaxID=413815 RepID=A0A521F372_9EURY|nr:glycosyltransferase [Halorubrum cibi]SMO90577.1 Glycosyltransferase involved in cell wall bisynthesis [Halorubrum cibi]
MSSSITLFIGNLTIGGAEQVTVNLANQLVENGHQVEVLVVTEQGKLINELSSSIEFSVLPIDRMRWSVVPLACHLRRTQPDVVISFLTAANVMTILAAQLSQVSSRIIVTEHSTQSETQAFSKKRDMILAKYTYSLADHVVGVSKGVSQDIRDWARISNDKVSTIYNPVISEEQFETVYALPSHQWFHDDEIAVVLSVGRHVEAKDYPTLIRAFARLTEERGDTRLLLLGGGKLTSEYESLAEQLEISEKVSMPGFVSDPYPYMAHSDVFALSSQWEGLSLVLIEAMACGTPVVSTDCPNGPSEILMNGEYGDLTPVGDSEALKDALLRILKDPIDPEKLQQRARYFSIREATAQYEGLFETVL